MIQLFRRLLKLGQLSGHLAKGLWLVYRHDTLDEQGCPDERFADISRKWHGELCDILGLRVTIHGAPPSTHALFIANHISWLDIPVLGSIAPVGFLSKAEVRQWPLIGKLAEKGGTLFIERGKRGASQQALTLITQRLNCPASVLLFPEGTTTDGQSVRRFFPRLLAAADTSATPIQPIAIVYKDNAGEKSTTAPFINQQSFFAHLWQFLTQPEQTVEVTFLPLVPANKQQDIKKVTAELEEEIRSRVTGA